MNKVEQTIECTSTTSRGNVSSSMAVCADLLAGQVHLDDSAGSPKKVSLPFKCAASGSRA